MSRQPDVWKCSSSSSKCCVSTHHNPSVPPSQGRRVLSPLPTNCCHGKWAKGHTETPVGCPLTKAYCSVNVEQITRLVVTRIQSSHRIPFITIKKTFYNLTCALSWSSNPSQISKRLSDLTCCWPRDQLFSLELRFNEDGIACLREVMRVSVPVTQSGTWVCRGWIPPAAVGFM